MPVLNLKLAEVEKVADWAREHDEPEIAEKAERIARPKPAEPIRGQLDIYGEQAA